MFYTKIFCCMKENLQRYLREMKDVFKELKVLVEKGKAHKLTKIYWRRFDSIYKYKHV